MGDFDFVLGVVYVVLRVLFDCCYLFVFDVGIDDVVELGFDMDFYVFIVLDV